MTIIPSINRTIVTAGSTRIRYSVCAD